MTNEQINYILDVEQYLASFRKTMVMRMPNEDEVKVRNIYQEVFGNPIPMCGSCFVDSFTSLVIKARYEKETQIPTLEEVTDNALILAQLADDEQKPRRKRK
jgi:hypothetical protein